MGKNNQVSGPHFLSDEIQSSFMKNMRFRKDTASAKSLNPIFSVMKSKTQRKLVFFTEQFQNMRFQKDTASAKSLNPIFSVMKFKKHKKLLFFHRAVSWKIWDSGRTLPVPSLWTSFSFYTDGQSLRTFFFQNFHFAHLEPSKNLHTKNLLASKVLTVRPFRCTRF